MSEVLHPAVRTHYLDVDLLHARTLQRSVAASHETSKQPVPPVALVPAVVELSRRSRQKFADLAAASGTVRSIEDLYAAHGFTLPANFQPPEGGQRRGVCAAAEAGVDVADPKVAQRLLRVYLDGIEDWGRHRDLWGMPPDKC